MIHPNAADDLFCAPLHRSFLLSSFASGTIALLFFPLHLAFAGPPHAAVIVVLAWMLSQWPLALYLSRSGALDRAMAFSCSMFAFVVASVCAMTGGGSSFALAWLLVPPLEAALSGSRSVAVGVATLCAALFGALLFAPGVPMGFEEASAATRMSVTFAAVFYAGLLSIKLSADRDRARRLALGAANKRDILCKAVSEVICELDTHGNVSVIGGPIRSLFGFAPGHEDANWLFERVHVADRPLYLTRISDAQRIQEETSFVLRLRTGASVPGEEGCARYPRFELKLRPAGRLQSCAPDRLLVNLRPLEQQDATGMAVTPANADARTPSHQLFTATRAEARFAFQEIVEQAERLQSVLTNAEPVDESDGIQRIRSAGEAGLACLDAERGRVEREMFDPALALELLDVNANIARCVKVLVPLAEECGVEIVFERLDHAPKVFGDGKLLRQSLCLVISDMIETSGRGATVRIGANMRWERQSNGSGIVFSVKNRSSSLTWSADESRALLRFANGLFARLGGALSIQTTLGQGESVVLDLRCSENSALPVHTQASTMPNLAKIA